MIKALRDLLDSLCPPSAEHGPAAAQRMLQMATAVMLVEVMRADASFGPGEREVVRAALREDFALSEADAASLEALAETEAKNATDYFTFTSVINERFGMAEKLRMIEQMWRVAYADGQLSEHERHVMWRISDLLHVPQGAYVNARIHAQRAAGVA